MNQKSSSSILIVEDEIVIGKKITCELKHFIDSKNIKLAKTIKEAFVLLDAYKFKIIVLDLSLPDGNGTIILDKIQEEKSNTLVYVFSINLELKKASIKKGAAAFFDKSEDFNDLISTVKSKLFG